MTLVKCPHCGEKFELTDSILTPLIQQHTDNLEKQLSIKTEEAIKLAASIDAERKNLELARVNLKEEIDLQVNAKLMEETKKIAREQLAKARKDAKEELEEELNSIREQLESKTSQVKELKKLELNLRQEKQDLEEAKSNLNLELARKLAEERDKLQRDIREQISQESMLALADRDKKLADMKIQIEELKRKSELGSQQAQGEVLELLLRDKLVENFPFDSVSDVPKGINGADCIQIVKTTSGEPCGKILWESKRTKAFNQDWILKLKEDQRAVNAEIAVIVTQTLPLGINTFGLVDGVWVVSIPLAIQLALALRVGILEVYAAKKATTNQSGKKEIMYNYLTGNQFKQRVEGIIEPFQNMRDALEKERRAITKIWAEREQQINRAVLSAAGLFGDIQGIAGKDILSNIESIALLE